MPWKACELVSIRQEFVLLALADDANVSALCRRFGISRKTGCKWINRYRQDGLEGLVDRSRRPNSSPFRSSGEVEEAVAAVRAEHPVWGARKIRRRLIDQGVDPELVPTTSTIGRILLRRGLIDSQESNKHKPHVRFEKERPNELWQMDFKGHVPMENGERCHPLTVLDDHSRFLLCLKACLDQTLQTVKRALIELFELYGLPWRILCDNGSPWGNSWDSDEPYTRLVVWLLKQQVQVSHGRPYHPQTQGKEERLHRTLALELLNRQRLWDLEDAQQKMDAWRDEYNQVRPHEAIGLGTPIRRYQISLRSYQPDPRAWEYEPRVAVRKVDVTGMISYRNQSWRIGKAFVKEAVGLQESEVDGLLDVLFNGMVIGTINLRSDRQAMCCAKPSVAALPQSWHSTEPVTHVPAQV